MNDLAQLKQISPINVGHIERLERELAVNGAKDATIYRYFFSLRSLVTEYRTRELADLSGEEIRDFLYAIAKSGYARRTQEDIKLAVKRFYRLIGQPEKVAWLHVNRWINDLKADALITDQERLLLLNNAPTPAAKAIIAVLADCGFRTGEMVGMKLRNVEFAPEGAVSILVDGKTGGGRVGLTFSASYLLDYLKQYRLAMGSPLWLDDWGFKRPKAASGAVILKMLKQTAFRAGISKRINIRIFRHTMVTNLKREGKDDAYIYRRARWSRTTKMLGTYWHYDATETVKATPALSGIAEQLAVLIAELRAERQEDAKQRQKMFSRPVRLLPK
jgi:site-specific recombinase XerD